jgi:hypothetical protein
MARRLIRSSRGQEVDPLKIFPRITAWWTAHATALHRVYAGILALWIAVIIAAVATGFATSWTHPLSDARLAGLQTELEHVTSDQPYLEFEAERLDPAQRVLHGFLRFWTPSTPRAQRTLVPPAAIRSGQDVELEVGAPIVPSSEFCTALCYGLIYRKSIKLQTIKNEEQPHERNDLSFPLDIPLKGSPDDYPQDAYRLDMVLIYTFPPSIQLPQPPPSTTELPFDPGRIEESVAISSGNKLTTYGGNEVIRSISLSFGRQWQYSFYIYVLATVPLLFDFLFLHVVFSRLGTRDSSLLDAMVALILTTLAILPLRLVLVPADIEGLTRVDLLLGLGLVLTLATAGWRYIHGIVHDSAAGGGTSEPGDPTDA